MGPEQRQFKSRITAVSAAVLLCLSPTFSSAAEPVLNRASPMNPAGQPNQLASGEIHPGTPMVLNPVSGAFEFDMGGSETQKLQLQLSHPLVLESGSHFQSSSNGPGLLGLDATLRMPLGNGFSLHGSAQQQMRNSEFQNLGSIQCMNGTLGPDSYTASDCHFITGASSGYSSSSFDRRQLSVGASQNFGNFTTAVNWFTSDTESAATGAQRLNKIDASALLLDNQLTVPFSRDNLLEGELTTDYLSSQTKGIDLNFQLGFATGQAGEVRLGLALTRVLDANFQGIFSNDLSPLDWNIAEPYDTAAVGVQWSSGSFSSGVRGFYREPVNFLNRESMDSVSTFDVHFTWRAPWNANLSIGTSNVLGSGVSDRSTVDEPSDRFESIYGRIPYVRYQQDL